MNSSEKEKHLENANDVIKQQKIQAEKALNELKKQIEYNSNKLYEDMKDQVRYDFTIYSRF